VRNELPHVDAAVLRAGDGQHAIPGDGSAGDCRRVLLLLGIRFGAVRAQTLVLRSETPIRDFVSTLNQCNSG